MAWACGSWRCWRRWLGGCRRGKRSRRGARAQLAAAVEDSERRGGRAQFNVCGETKRLCVLVNEGAGGWGRAALPEGQVYRVIQGC